MIISRIVLRIQVEDIRVSAGRQRSATVFQLSVFQAAFTRKLTRHCAKIWLEARWWAQSPDDSEVEDEKFRLRMPLRHPILTAARLSQPRYSHISTLIF